MENKDYQYIYLGERRVIKGKNYPIENEVWKKHPEFPLMVSNFGKIFSMKRNKVCKQCMNNHYREYQVNSRNSDYPNGKWVYVKDLVYQCFGDREKLDLLEYAGVITQLNDRTYDNSIDNLTIVNLRQYLKKKGKLS